MDDVGGREQVQVNEAADSATSTPSFHLVVQFLSCIVILQLLQKRLFSYHIISNHNLLYRPSPIIRVSGASRELCEMIDVLHPERQYQDPFVVINQTTSGRETTSPYGIPPEACPNWQATPAGWIEYQPRALHYHS